MTTAGRRVGTAVASGSGGKKILDTLAWIELKHDTLFLGIGCRAGPFSRELKRGVVDRPFAATAGGSSRVPAHVRGGDFSFKLSIPAERFAVRDFSKVPQSFWSGPRARLMRDMGAETQLLAVYLRTAPSANMIGVYNLPILTIANDTALSPAVITLCFENLRSLGFAAYDFELEWVFLPDEAQVQVGARLSPRDNNRKSVLKQVGLIDHPFADLFVEHYREAYQLGNNAPPVRRLHLNPALIGELIKRSGRCCTVCGSDRECLISHKRSPLIGGRTEIDNLQWLCLLHRQQKDAADRRAFWDSLVGIYPTDHDPVVPDLQQSLPGLRDPFEAPSKVSEHPFEGVLTATATATVTATVLDSDSGEAELVGGLPSGPVERPRDRMMTGRAIQAAAVSTVVIGSDTFRWPTAAALIALYNREAADELNAVEIASSDRVMKATDYLKRFPDFEFWKKVMAETKRSRKLRGLDPSPDFPNFQADFDWLLSTGKGSGVENCVRVYEGRYRDNAKNKR